MDANAGRADEVVLDIVSISNCAFQWGGPTPNAYSYMNRVVGGVAKEVFVTGPISIE
jgi:hypothetical protein